MIGIWNPSSTDRESRNPVPGIRIQDFKIFFYFLAKGDAFVLTPVTHRICGFKKRMLKHTNVRNSIKFITSEDSSDS